MATYPTSRNTIVTLDDGTGVQRFEAVEPIRRYHASSSSGLALSLPHVIPLPANPYFYAKENTITDEEKQQRTLAEHAEKITREFRNAERGLLEEADLKRKEEREREARNADRRSRIKQAINNAFDAGLYEEDIEDAIHADYKDGFQTMLGQLRVDVSLDNLLADV